MATKTNGTNGTTKNKKPAGDEALAALKKKIAGLGKDAQTLILKAASGTKLTKQEVGKLRSEKVKTNGDPIAIHKGPRAKTLVNENSVRDVYEVAQEAGLTKMFGRYGQALKRPFNKFLASVTDTAQKAALTELGRTFFPRQRGAGFQAREDQIVGKTLRVAILVGEIAGHGARVKREVMTLVDGRQGVFVWKVTEAPAAAPAPVAAASAAPWATA